MEPINDKELQGLDKDIVLDNSYMNVSGQSIDVPAVGVDVARDNDHTTVTIIPGLIEESLDKLHNEIKAIEGDITFHICKCGHGLHNEIQKWVNNTKIMSDFEYIYEDDRIECLECGREYYPTTGQMTVEVNINDFEDDLENPETPRRLTYDGIELKKSITDLYHAFSKLNLHRVWTSNGRF